MPSAIDMKKRRDEWPKQFLDGRPISGDASGRFRPRSRHTVAGCSSGTSPGDVSTEQRQT